MERQGLGRLRQRRQAPRETGVWASLLGGGWLWGRTKERRALGGALLEARCRGGALRRRRAAREARSESALSAKEGSHSKEALGAL